MSQNKGESKKSAKKQQSVKLGRTSINSNREGQGPVVHSGLPQPELEDMVVPPYDMGGETDADLAELGATSSSKGKKTKLPISPSTVGGKGKPAVTVTSPLSARKHRDNGSMDETVRPQVQSSASSPVLHRSPLPQLFHHQA